VGLFSGITSILGGGGGGGGNTANNSTATSNATADSASRSDLQAIQAIDVELSPQIGIAVDLAPVEQLVDRLTDINAVTALQLRRGLGDVAGAQVTADENRADAFKQLMTMAGIGLVIWSISKRAAA
jgi:hypothetical protein